MSIVIDSREPKDYQMLGDTVATLDCDALVVGDRKKYIIERKEVNDLWRSLHDGRLFNQLSVLSKAREEGYVPILVVQGNFGKYVKLLKKTKSQVLGLEIAIAGFVVPTIYCSGYSDYALLLKMLKEKAGKKTEYRLPSLKKKEISVEDERVMMLMGVKGIGQKKAKELIKKYVTIKSVIDNIEETQAILGDKCYKHFREVILGGEAVNV